ncbi:hypothetical protein [Nonomuraea sp. NPDC052265]|uniref:hypothetical protein n=1 Tax=Nonomuraea sp. NPDC052265 TaxID=3364374 RepID=UPI0037C5D154
MTASASPAVSVAPSSTAHGTSQTSASALTRAVRWPVRGSTRTTHWRGASPPESRSACC